MKNKKMIFGFLAVLAIAAMAAWNVSFGSKTDRLSDIALANVEALAQESGSERVQIETIEDGGRKNIQIGGVWQSCHVDVHKCWGTGDHVCVAGDSYTECYDI